jgi:uncharacterized membrane protein YiaA
MYVWQVYICKNNVVYVLFSLLSNLHGCREYTQELSIVQCENERCNMSFLICMLLFVL